MSSQPCADRWFVCSTVTTQVAILHVGWFHYRHRFQVFRAVRFPRWLIGVLVGLIVIGIVFRFVNLNHKVYSREEVYTTIRAAGYSRSEIERALFQNQPIPAVALQQYQQLKPGSSAIDTVRSLAVEEPQQPPLYFLVTRGWMQTVGESLARLFKSPLTVMRSLPALLSLLALPAMYWLAWELFAAHSVSLLATTLIALSPFDVLSAQTARQYSLLTVMVLVSSSLLLRAIRLFQASASQSATAQRHAIRQPSTWLNWGLYALSLLIGLYTHPLFVLTVVSQAVYIGGCSTWDAQFRKHRHSILQFFVGAIVIAVVSFSPWLMVIMTHFSQATNPMWRQNYPGFDNAFKQWALSFTSPFIDLSGSAPSPIIDLLHLLFLSLIGMALYTLCRRTPLVTWLFVVVLIAVPWLLLVLPKLGLSGNPVLISRYVLLCHPGIQLAVAYFLATQLSMKRLYTARSRLLTRNYSAYNLRLDPQTIVQTWLWRSVLTGVVLTSLASLIISALSFTWWDKGGSYDNNQMADLLNKMSLPTVISDTGDKNTNTADLISLSYHLKETVQLLPLKSADFVNQQEFQTTLVGRTAIAFRPSKALQQGLEQQYGQLSPMPKTEQLWKISVTSNQKLSQNKPT